MMNGIISDAGLHRQHAVRIRGAYVPLTNYIKIPKYLELLQMCEISDPLEQFIAEEILFTASLM